MVIVLVLSVTVVPPSTPGHQNVTGQGCGLPWTHGSGASSPTGTPPSMRVFQGVPGSTRTSPPAASQGRPGRTPEGSRRVAAGAGAVEAAGEGIEGGAAAADGPWLARWAWGC